VLGHPADAVAWLADALAERGDALRAGDLVTTGSTTRPVPVAAGETVVARFSSLGSVVAHAA
jgi:2-keto-4-pentenoate hydratase